MIERGNTDGMISIHAPREGSDQQCGLDNHSQW